MPPGLVAAVKQQQQQQQQQQPVAALSNAPPPPPGPVPAHAQSFQEIQAALPPAPTNSPGMFGSMPLMPINSSLPLQIADPTQPDAPISAVPMLTAPRFIAPVPVAPPAPSRGPQSMPMPPMPQPVSQSPEPEFGAAPEPMQAEEMAPMAPVVSAEAFKALMTMSPVPVRPMAIEAPVEVPVAEAAPVAGM